MPHDGVILYFVPFVTMYVDENMCITLSSGMPEECVESIPVKLSPISSFTLCHSALSRFCCRYRRTINDFPARSVRQDTTCFQESTSHLFGLRKALPVISFNCQDIQRSEALRKEFDHTVVYSFVT